MTKPKMLLGVAAACAACCAAPLALPVLLAAFTGAGLAGIGAAVSAWWLAAAGLAVVGVSALAIFRRRRAAQGCEGAGA